MVTGVRVRARTAVRADGQGRREPGSCVVPVDQQAAERRQDEEHDDEVQQRAAAHHQVQAVHCQQRAGQAAQERRTEKTACCPAQHEHRQCAQGRGHEPPAERVEAERPLAEGDHPLARRRVCDEGPGVGERDRLGVGEDLRVGDLAVRPGALVAEPQQGPGVLGVVGLVEDEAPRPAEVPEAERSGQDRDEQRPQPVRRLRHAAGTCPIETYQLPQADRRLREGRNKTLAGVGPRTCHVSEAAKPPLPVTGLRRGGGAVGGTRRVLLMHCCRPFLCVSLCH